MPPTYRPVWTLTLLAPYAGLAILLLPLCLLLGAGLKSLAAPAATPAYGPGPDAPCPEISPNGRFCAGVADFSGLTVQAEDGRRLDMPLWKWSRFLGWSSDGRFAFVDNYDQYGNHRGLVVDTATWTLWQPHQDAPCTWGMSGMCRAGFALIAYDHNWVLLDSGLLYDLEERTGRSLFPEDEAMFVWPAALGPAGRTVVLLAGPLSTLGPTSYEPTLFLASVDAAETRPVDGLTFTAGELDATMFSWDDDGARVRFSTGAGARIDVDVASGRWTREP